MAKEPLKNYKNSFNVQIFNRNIKPKKVSNQIYRTNVSALQKRERIYEVIIKQKHQKNARNCLSTLHQILQNNL